MTREPRESTCSACETILRSEPFRRCTTSMGTVLGESLLGLLSSMAVAEEERQDVQEDRSDERRKDGLPNTVEQQRKADDGERNGEPEADELDGCGDELMTERDEAVDQ